MKYSENSDNKYPTGMSIFAKDSPKVKLIIDSYQQRIYYCATANHPEAKHLAYYERELVDPRASK
jgi:hypothetical protein